MFQWKARFVLAIALAAFSAIGMGVGLLSLGPALSLILDPKNGRSLIQLAQDHNATDTFFQVPENFIAILPEGRFDGVLYILILMACLTVLGGIANFLHQYISAWLAILVVADVR